MKQPKPEALVFVGDVEKFAGKKFAFGGEIARLVQASNDGKKEAMLDELTFQAKFISRSQNILKQSGMDNQETAKLKNEFEKSLEMSKSLLSALLSDCPAEFNRDFSERFLSMTQSGLTNLLRLLYELSWIKNYWLDHENKKG